MDDWFLSLTEKPDKLDRSIKSLESARTVGLIAFVIVAIMYFLVVFKSSNEPLNNGFMFGLFVMMMVINSHTDTYIKMLKLHRHNLSKH